MPNNRPGDTITVEQYRKLVEKSTSEEDFQRSVIRQAQQAGWRVAHFRKARQANGHWMTPVQADGAGWPDLVLAKKGRGILYRELKTMRGVVSDDQQAWLDLLVACGADAKVWRPSDQAEIDEVLQ